MQKPIKTLVCLALATSLIGCASTSSDESQQTITTNVQLELFDELKTKLDAAVKHHSDEELKWFAAKAYASMTEALKEARETYSEFEHDPKKINDSSLFSSQTYGQEMLEALNVFEMAHKSAEDTRQRVLTVMAVAFENREYLNKANAATVFPNDFKRVERQLKQVVDHVANNAEIDNEKLVSLEKSQHQLEAKAVTKHYLGQSELVYKKQKQQRYASDAPLVMARSEAALVQAKAFIQGSPRQHDEIQQRADAVEFALQRADKIVLQVRELKALPEKQYERYILNLEQALHGIATASAAGDFRNETLKDHAKLIEQAMVSSSQNDQQKWQSLALELEKVKQDWQQDIAAFSAQSKSLSAEKQALETQVLELEAKAQKSVKIGEPTQAAPVAETPEAPVAEPSISPKAAESVIPQDKVNSEPMASDVDAQEAVINS
jgi:hypothetical protein